MTPEQLEALKNLARLVRSSFPSLAESEVVGRIMLLTGKDLVSSINGYELMRSKMMLEGFVRKDTLGKFVSMIRRYPNLVEMFDAWKIIPQGMEVGEYEGFKIPSFEKAQEIIKRMDLPAF
jgi:hypothetical protein